MNKLKKIFLTLERALLSIKYVINEKWYIKANEKYLKHMGVCINHPKFIARDVKIDSTDPSKITIGKNTVITSKVTLLVHDYSIECGLVAIGKQDPAYESLFIRPIVIGDNCFIGQQTFIKPGTIIGNNCIIGAGSVVNGTIPDDSVVIGNPCRVVCKTSEWATKKYVEHNYVRGSKRRN